MHFKNYPGCHLTYCTNIHPGESWSDVLVHLKKNLPELKRRISPGQPFGVGLRLSAVAAAELLASNHMNQFKNWLQTESLYVFTLNGFPYGSFHHKRVKDEVYKPDWQTKERVHYTLNLMTILAELLPEGIDGGISTSPLSYKYWPGVRKNEEIVLNNCMKHLASIAYEMAETEKKTGKELHLDIEPEPDCILENTHETISFFTGRLFTFGTEYLAKEFGLSEKTAKKLLQRHIRICYDTCHFAVEFEDSERMIKEILDAGIKIGKTQISAALKVNTGRTKTEQQRMISRLSCFDEPTYLHQVVERRPDGRIQQYRDLSQALELRNSDSNNEWRIHFHVPLFTDEFDGLLSTRDSISENVAYLLKYSDCRHFEIETYTWEVLPEGLKTNLLDSIESEIRWTLQLIGEHKA